MSPIVRSVCGEGGGQKLRKIMTHSCKNVDRWGGRIKKAEKTGDVIYGRPHM